MQNHNLWAPWRMEYIHQLDPATPQGSATTVDGVPTPKTSDCFLCACAHTQGDAGLRRQRLVLHHDDQGMIVLNRYPYTSGHLLVAPAEHVGELEHLTASQRAGLMELVVKAQQVLRIAYNPQGFNVGINLGRCAGAGLPGHVHVHIVPRWNGDTNFTSVVAGVRVIPQGIEQAYDQLMLAMKGR